MSTAGDIANLIAEIRKTGTAFLESRLWRGMKIVGKRVRAEKFQSIAELQESFRAGKLKDGQIVKVVCKPALVGPIFKLPFVQPSFCAMAMRHQGDQAPTPSAITRHGQVATPLFFMPPVASEVSQVFLYTQGTQQVGMISRSVSHTEDYLVATFPDRFLQYCHMPCEVTAAARLLGPTDLEAANVGSAIYQELLSTGNVWALDATIDEAECKPTDTGNIIPVRGTLYSAGHWELPMSAIGPMDIMRIAQQTMIDLGLESFPYKDPRPPHDCLIKSEEHNISINLSGIWPYYSVHADTDFGEGLASRRKLLDTVTLNLNDRIRDLCRSRSVILANPNDLDFTYSPKSEDLTVMESPMANDITDPVAIAIRDWHRTRNG